MLGVDGQGMGNYNNTMGTGIKPLNPLGDITKGDRPSMHYVYYHRRGGPDGDVFYVGKGSGKRAWELSDRGNRHWLAVARKYGCYVSVIMDDMTKKEALDLEVKVISKFGFYNLTNASTGGDSGRAGVVAWNRVAIECSNGMSFDSGSKAADWLVSSGRKSAGASAIYACCKGVYNGAYGYSWWYKGGEPKDFISGPDQRKIKIYCSNGMEFDSQKDAANWVKETITDKGATAPISQCLQGIQKSAYGLTWAYKKSDLTKYKERFNAPKSVICSNGMIFETISDAARWLNANGYPAARPGGICETLKGRQHTSYGFTWQYYSEAE